MSLKSALYFGKVMHRRHRPRPHKLRYRVFWMLIDLDEAETLANRLTFFSHNRFNLASLHDADHGDGSAVPLRTQVERHLVSAGLTSDRVFLLCMPRILGYSFNPLSIYFCCKADGTINAILYEVHNTFGERHSYLIPVPQQTGPIEQSCQKEFYVSPFLAMNMTYAFRVSAGPDRISVAVRAGDDKGPMIDASLAARSGDLNDWALLRSFFAYPLLTLKVVAAIHWHAVKMLLKGYRISARPKAPRHLVTIVEGQS
jgi:DUF1365 family protein